MKCINFVTAHPLEHHNTLCRWFIISSVCLLMLMAALLTVSIKQLQLLHQLKTLHTQLLDYQKDIISHKTTHSKLSEHNTALILQAKKYTQHKDIHKDPIHILSLINSLLYRKPDMHMKAFSLHKKKLMFEFTCSKPSDAIEFIKELQDTHVFETSVLTSLTHQQHDNSSYFLGTIQATLSCANFDKPQQPK